MDDIPGTAEQKFCLMLLERIDALTDAFNKQEKELHELKEYLPPPRLPTGVYVSHNRFESFETCYVRLKVEARVPLREVVQEMDNVSCFGYHECETKNLFTILRDGSIVGKYDKHPPYKEPDWTDMTYQLIVYFSKKDFMRRFALALHKGLKAKLPSLAIIDLYVQGLTDGVDKTFLECAMSASQQNKSVEDLGFGEHDGIHAYVGKRCLGEGESITEYRASLAKPSWRYMELKDYSSWEDVREKWRYLVDDDRVFYQTTFSYW